MFTSVLFVVISVPDGKLLVSQTSIDSYLYNSVLKRNFTEVYVIKNYCFYVLCNKVMNFHFKMRG